MVLSFLSPGQIICSTWPAYHTHTHTHAARATDTVWHYATLYFLSRYSQCPPVSLYGGAVRCWTQMACTGGRDLQVGLQTAGNGEALRILRAHMSCYQHHSLAAVMVDFFRLTACRD